MQVEKQPPTFPNPQVGDHVCRVISKSANKPNPVFTIVKVTPTQILLVHGPNIVAERNNIRVLRETGREFGYTMGGYYRPATADEVKARADYEEKQREETRQRNAEREAYEARVDVQLARRLADRSVEGLLLLGPEVLARMVAIIDLKIMAEGSPQTLVDIWGGQIGYSPVNGGFWWRNTADGSEPLPAGHGLPVGI